ncbi:MAG TPA: NB-ARC domain-containing protein [Pseudonocardiaceae bacterium]|nr:NB-ARC domain-containing protein [Pseudonocardiaceae bacterium]
MRQVWRVAALVVAGLVAATAATVVAIAINVATGGSSPWLPPVQAHPLRWMVGATLAVAASGLLVWWVQHVVDQRLAALVPAEQRPESWVVDRPVDVSKVVAALRRRGHGTVGITTAVQGAGGFGKTTVAKLVRADRRVLRYFDGRVYWVTLGRDVRSRAAIVAKVNDLLTRLVPDRSATFTDPEQAGEHLAAVLAARPRTLLVLDDVWYPEQEAAFPLGGTRSARLITTRILSLVDQCVPVRVDEVTPEQARKVLTAGLPQPPQAAVDALLAHTGRWPLLLRLVNKVLTDQLQTTSDIATVTRDLLDRLDCDGLRHVLDGAARRPLDVNDDRQRQLAVTTTIEASTGLLSAEEQQRFAELAIFVEDETVPVALIGLLWRATGGLDVMASRALCARLGDLALLAVTSTPDGGVVGLHDVVRDYLTDTLGPARIVDLHRILLDTVAAGLPTALRLAADAGDGVDAATAEPVGVAWWAMEESARYLWDHVVEHLVAADRVTTAETLAADLRWVGARLEQSGPAAPYADLAAVNTSLCQGLRRLLGQTAHLLAPANPAHSLIDILYTRVQHDPHWAGQVRALMPGRGAPRLVNRWPLPDLPDPSLRRTLAGDDGGLEAVAVAPDGTWLATASLYDAVRIWDAVTGAHRRTLTGHTSDVRAVAIAPDGLWLASVGDDQSVRIWDATSGALRRSLTGHRGDVLAVVGVVK